MTSRISRLVDHRVFQVAILAVIALNSALIGAATYPSIVRRYGDALDTIDAMLLGVFVIEIVLRILAHGRQPQNFLRSGWNVFDLVIVALALLPALLGSGVTVLRALRIVRVLRLISAFRDLRIIVSGMIRSLMPLAGVALLMGLLVYVYAVVGTTLFGEMDADSWGQVGAASLSVFRILTLENWDEMYFAVGQAGPVATVYFVSFIIIATLVVLNLVIAVFVSSVEQARANELAEEVRAVSLEVGVRTPELADLIAELRQSLDVLEIELAARSNGEPSA